MRVNGVQVGEYLTIDLEAPFSAQRYLEAIQVAESAGVEFLIIDSLTHAWTGAGGLLELQNTIASRSGNSYTAWREVTPHHNRLIDRILQCPMHVVVTMRTKVEYAIEENERGKKTPKKIGMAPVFRDGVEYEFSTFFDIAQDHTATTSKDRTGLFDGQYFTISPGTGEQFYRWLENGDMEPQSTPPVISKPKMTLAEMVDQVMKAHCAGMNTEQKAEVTKTLREITGGTANYKTVTDPEILKAIYDHFREATE